MNDIDDVIVGQLTHSSDWDNTGADDKRRASKIEEQEKDVQSSASEDEGERRYWEVAKQGVHSKVKASISTWSSMLTLCLFSHTRRVMQHVTYDYSSTRMLTPLMARSGQAFIASSACKYTSILLFYLINLNLEKWGHRKRTLFL